MNNSLAMKFSIVVLIAGLALVGSYMATVGALSVTTSSTPMSIMSRSLSADTSVVIKPLGVTRAGSNQAAVGNTCGTAVEMTTGLAATRTALTNNSWYDEVEVYESVAGSAPVTTYYKVEIFADSVSRGFAYMKNATNSAGTNPEGVVFRADLGNITSPPDLQDNYMVTVINLGSVCS